MTNIRFLRVCTCQTVYARPNGIKFTIWPSHHWCTVIFTKPHPSLINSQCLALHLQSWSDALGSAFLFVSVSAGAEATGPSANGGQVLSGEVWWVTQPQHSACIICDSYNILWHTGLLLPSKQLKYDEKWNKICKNRTIFMIINLSFSTIFDVRGFLLWFSKK